MIKLLARIPSIRKAILRYAFEQKSKPSGFEILQFVFRDEDGRGWYTWNSEFDLFVRRKAEVDGLLVQLSAQLSKREVTDIVAAMETALNRPGSPDLAMVAHLVIEMKKRAEMYVHEEIMYDLLAIHYVREDERPEVVDQEIQRQKVEYLRSSGNMAFFFENKRLIELLPWLATMEKHLAELLTDTKIEIQALRKQVENYS